MLALYALGRQDEALARYRRLYDHLRELGLTPIPTTGALQVAILRGESVESLLPRPQEWATIASAEAGVVILDPWNDRFVELLERGGGWLVPPDDPAALSQALNRLHREPKTRARLAARARERAESYSWDRVSKELLDVYSTAMEPPKAATSKPCFSRNSS